MVGGANQLAPPTGSEVEEEGPESQRARVMSPNGIEEIRDAIRGG